LILKALEINIAIKNLVMTFRLFWQLDPFDFTESKNSFKTIRASFKIKREFKKKRKEKA